MRCLLLLLAWSLSCTIYSQTTLPPDSVLVAFSHVGNDDTALAKSAVDRLDALAIELAGEFRHNKPEKSIQKLFKKVHDRLFRLYDENPVFMDIFRGGRYNCVTASAVYAYLFERLDIPYAIRELPTHVYVIAYPGTYDIMVESTVPDEVSLRQQRREMEAYREELLANKMITPAQAADPNFFYDTFGPDTIITFSGLYGVQLYNYSLTHLEAGAYFPSLELLERAEEYHPGPVIDGAMMTNLLLLGENSATLSAEEQCRAVKIYSRHVDLIDSTTISGMMGFYYLIAGEPDLPAEVRKLEELRDCIAESAIDELYRQAILEAADLMAAVYYHQTLQHEQALELLQRSYNPDNTKAYLLIKSVLAERLQEHNDFRSGLDTLAKYETIFPFLRDDPTMGNYGLWCYANLILMHYNLDEPEEGARWFDRFRDRYPVDGKRTYSPEIIGNIFGAISAYHVRKKEEDLALEWLERGLEYAPDSYELRRKIKLLQSDTW